MKKRHKENCLIVTSLAALWPSCVALSWAPFSE